MENSEQNFVDRRSMDPFFDSYRNSALSKADKKKYKVKDKQLAVERKAVYKLISNCKDEKEKLLKLKK
jgi:hypothetical protein